MYLKAVEVELHMDGFTGKHNPVVTASGCQQPVIQLAPQACPGILGLPDQDS